MSRAKPIVLVPACSRPIGDHPFYAAGKKYIEAVRLAGCTPLIVPSVPAHELDALLAMADGVLLTGSPSNVHPSHFDEAVHDPSLPLDTERDDWTLPLIPKALELGMPLFAICRGFQEANVALGGTLHQAVQEQPGLHDHRAPKDLSAEEQYAPVHPIDVVPGGLLHQIVGSDTIQVNSLHGQGVKQLAPGLRVEATAPDGLIEAFSVEQSGGFNLCVQWHPEWQAASNPASMAVLTAFGQACRQFHQDRQQLQQRDPET
ncbi:MAG: gamma-glutamyl-gamma-aminobutyrate hydrolase family protein [Burkholderiaceae bacterium]|nr:gamma-glutamyl-gamma-aminobutyrate hydrolase family protein [Burkholderiaceae bacterium]